MWLDLDMDDGSRHDLIPAAALWAGSKNKENF